MIYQIQVESLIKRFFTTFKADFLLLPKVTFGRRERLERREEEKGGCTPSLDDSFWFLGEGDRISRDMEG